MDEDIILIPASAIIPTANRATVLAEMIASLAAQSHQPAEIIIIDSSENGETDVVAHSKYNNLQSIIQYFKATDKGAATQRNQGIEKANHPFIFFMDDDIIFEKDCVQAIWNAINSKENAAGVNAMITNQRYHTPGRFTSLMYRLMSGKKLESYAGKCIGPAWNLLPEDNEQLPAVVPVEWLNTTCTLYRREALPAIVFDSYFTGYSLMEDLALSLRVAKQWNLYNARNARIFHNSQPGIHKNSVYKIARMELMNRRYIMSVVLSRNSFTYYCKLCLFETFGIVSTLTGLQGWKNLLPTLAGKTGAWFSIMFGKRNNS